MIDPSTPQGKSKIAELFRRDINQPLIQLALYRSFRKFKTLQEQVVNEYVQKTRLPEEFFHNLMTEDMARELLG